MSAAVAVALMSLNPAWVGSAAASPIGGQVAAGVATIQQPNAQSTIIHQSTPRAVLNWQSFGIGAGESVVFRQPSSSAVALNRVIGPDASVISGTLQANGHVFLLNPSGVLFSKGASVDVGGLVASTLAISNNDFMAGRYVFSGGAGSGAVINEGSIRAADGGYVALIGNQVGNTGTIVANAGSVALGAGDSMLLDFGGDGLLNLKVNAAAAAARIDSGGLIQADGGRVIMSAQAKNALTATALNVDGIVRARGLTERNGQIFLDGGRSGVTQVSGTLDASSANAGQKGGEVRVLGEYVGLFGNALLDASGPAGGGTVLVGGDFQGSNPDVSNALRTYVGPNALIRADATANGDGGKVIVWADDLTRYYGSISAHGGAAGGNGGFAEVSGKGVLIYDGKTDLRAPHGRTGTLLLDPIDISISNGGTDSAADVAAFANATCGGADNAAICSISPATLDAAGANVILQAQDAISVSDAVNLATTADANLTMQAGRRIDVNAGVQTNGAGRITLVANNTDNGETDAAGVPLTGSGGTNRSAGTGDLNINGVVQSGTGAIKIVSSGATTNGGEPGSVQLNQNVTTGGNVTVSAAGGSITRSGAATTVTGNLVTLTAATGIGFPGGGGPVFTSATTLVATNTTSGNILIAEATGVDLAGLTTSAGNGNIQVTTTNGSITTSGAISANGAGTVTLTAGGAGSTLTVSNPITSGSGAVQLTAVDGVMLNGATGDVTTTGSYTVIADSNTDATGTYTQNNAGSAVSSGAVQITAADVVLTGTIAGGAADVTFLTSTAAATIGIEDATKNLNLTNPELSNVSTTGTIIAGSAGNTGGITIGTDAALAQGAKNFQFTTAGNIAIGANNFATTGNVGLTADNAGNIAAISSGAGVIGAAAVTAVADAGIGLNTSAATVSATNTTSGAVTIADADGVSVSGSNTGGGAFSVTAGGAGNTLTVNAGNINANTGSVTLQADEMVLTGTVTGNGGVNLRPNTAGTAITLGSGTAGLDFTNTALQQVFTTGVLTIGSDSAPAAGSITIDGPIAGGTNWTTLSLRTGAAVVDGNAAAGPDITVGNGVTQGNLAIRAATGIGSAVDPLETSGGGNANGLNLAYSNPGAGGVSIANTGRLNIAAVDGLTASNGGTGATTLSSSSPLTIAADVIQVGSIDMTAGEDPGAIPGDDLTVNTGVTVRSTGGDVTLRAGDQVTLAGTALVESTNAGGSVTLIAGFGDNDTAGAITGAGRASAPNVALDALTGIGAVGTRFNTTAGTLAARTRTSGDVFITELDGVILDTIGGVTNSTNGTGLYSLAAGSTAAHAITVNAPISTTPTAADTIGGGVLLDAAGAIVLQGTGSITTTGNGNGAGGEVFLHAGTSITQGAAITATGGAGGNGAVVTLMADNGSIGVNADIDVSRGAGGANDGAAIQLQAAGTIIGAGALRGDSNTSLAARTTNTTGDGRISLTGGGTSGANTNNRVGGAGFSTATTDNNGSITFFEGTGLGLGGAGGAGTLVSPTDGHAANSIVLSSITTVAGSTNGAITVSAGSSGAHLFSLGAPILTTPTNAGTVGGSVLLESTGALTLFGGGTITTTGNAAAAGEVFLHRVAGTTAAITMGTEITAPGGVVTMLNDQGNVIVNGNITGAVVQLQGAGSITGTGALLGEGTLVAKTTNATGDGRIDLKGGGTSGSNTNNRVATATFSTATADDNGSVTFFEGTALTIGAGGGQGVLVSPNDGHAASSVTATSGITTRAGTGTAPVSGAVQISVGSTGAHTLAVNDAINTTPTTAGRAGGSVILESTGALTLAGNGTLTTTGNAAGAGGEVFLHHIAGTTAPITLGADINATGGANGNGAVVTVLNQDGSIAVDAGIDVSRGAAGANDGTIQLRATSAQAGIATTIIGAGTLAGDANGTLIASTQGSGDGRIDLTGGGTSGASSSNRIANVALNTDLVTNGSVRFFEGTALNVTTGGGQGTLVSPNGASASSFPVLEGIKTDAGGTNGAVTLSVGSGAGHTLTVSSLIRTDPSLGNPIGGGSVLLEATDAITLATAGFAAVRTDSSGGGPGGEVFLHHIGGIPAPITLGGIIQARGSASNGGVVTILNDQGDIVVNASIDVSRRGGVGTDGTIQLQATTGSVTGGGALVSDTNGSLLARAGGNISLGGSVNTAAFVAGGSIDYTDTTRLTIGTAGGVGTLTAPSGTLASSVAAFSGARTFAGGTAGHVAVSAGTDLTIDQSIATTPTPTNTAGGSVFLTAGTTITSTAVTGTITTTGSSSAAGGADTAGAGGEVLLHSTGVGAITLNAGIVASGGASVEAGDTGGAGGVVTVRNDSGSVTLHNITTDGGAPGGGTAGAGGTIQLRTSTAGSAIGQQAATALLARGGVAGANDGNLKVDSTGAVTLTNAANDVGTLAGRMGDLAGAFSYTDATALTIGTVASAGTGVATMAARSGITTNGGDVTMTGLSVSSTVADTITTTAAVDSGAPSGDVVINATGNPGAINLAGNIVTTGASNNAGPGSAGGDVSLATTNGGISVANITADGGAATAGVNAGGNAGTITFSVGGANNLTLNGNLNAVGGGGNGGGNGGIGRALVFNAPVLLGNNDVTINTRGGTGGAAGASGDITFNASVDSAAVGSERALTLNSAGLTTFGDNAGDDRVGSGAGRGALLSLTTDAGGKTVFNVAPANQPTVTTTAAQTYNDDVLLAQSATLLSTAGGGGGNISVTGTTNGTAGGVAESLTVTAGTGNVTFTGNVGNNANSNELEGLTLTSAATALFSGNIELASGISQSAGSVATTFDGTVNVGSATLTGTAFNVNNSFSTAGALTVTNAGTFTKGPTGPITAAGGFSASGNVALANNITTSDTNLTIGGNLVIAEGQQVTLSTGAAGGGNIVVTGTTNGTTGGATESLTALAGTGNVTFTGNVGNSTNATELEALTISSAATTLFSGNVELAGALTQSAGSVATTFDGTVNVGSAALTGTAFNVNNNFTTAGALTVTNSGLFTKGATGTIVAGGGFTASGNASLANNITTTDTDLTIGGNLVIAEATALTLSTGAGGAGNILVSGDTNATAGGAGESLTAIAGTGNVTLAGNVGGTARLSSVTATGAAISLPTVSTTGAQSYTGTTSTTLNGNLDSNTAGAITITGPALLGAGPLTVQTAGAAATDDIIFTGTIDGAQSLTLNAGAGDVLVQGIIGGVTPLTGFSATGNTVGLSTLNAAGTVALTADDMTLGPVNAGGQIVALRNRTLGRGITLGGEPGGTLGLSATEIANITADKLRIGRNDAAAAGAITVPSTVTPNVNELHLIGETITGAAGGVVVPALVLEAGTTDLSNPSADVITLAAVIGPAGNPFTYSGDANGVIVGTVDGIVGITTNNGNVTLATGGALRLDQPIVAGTGTVSLQGSTVSNNGVNGSVTAGALNTVSTTGSTTLDSINNNVAAYSGQANTAGSIITFADTNGFNVSGIAAAGSEARLLAATGAITQTAGTVVAGQLSVVARDSSAFALAGNDIGTLSASIAGANQTFTYRDSNAYTAGITGLAPAGANSVQTNAGNVTLTADTGTLTLANPIAAGGATVSLNATAGAIAQNTGAGVTADTLTGSAGTSATLDKNNALTNLAAFTTNGAFTLNDAGGLNVTGAVTTQNNGLASVATSGTLAVTTGSVSGAGVSLSTSAAGDITLNGAVNGNAGDVVLTSAGLVSQTATGVINTTGALTGSAGSAATLDQANTIASLGAFTTNGNFTLNDASGGLMLTGAVSAGPGAVSITTTGGALALQSNDVSGMGGATLQGAGVTSTGGTISTVAGANSGTPSGAVQVIATGTGAIDLAGSIVSRGADSNAGAASTAGNVTLTSNNGAIAVGAVDARGGDGTAGNVSGGNAGTIAFNVGGGNTLTLSGDQVSRGGDASGTGNAGSGRAFNVAGPARLGADLTVITRQGAGAGAATAGAVTFGSTLDSATATGRSLTVTTPANATFAGAVGGTNPLGSLTTNGGGTTLINGGAVTTTGAQTYADALTLGAATTTLTSTGGQAIGFGSTLDGASNLTVTTGGSTTFSGSVGGTTALTSLATTGGGTTAINGGAVTTTGAQTYGDAVALGANSIFNSTGGGAIAFATGIDGAVSVTVNTAGTTAFAGLSGATNPLASIVTDAPGQTSFAGSIASSGTQTYNDLVIVAGNSTLASSAGNISFASTIDADAAANNRTLAVNAPAGTVTFSGNIGATQALADLDVVAGPTTIVFNGGGTQTVNVSAQGGNTATFNAPVLLATNLVVNTDGAVDNNVTFAGTVNADAFANNRTLSVTSGTGTTSFGAAVGNAQELGALAVSGNQLVLGGNVSISGGGAVNLSGVQVIGFAPGIAIDTDRAGGATPGGNVLLNALGRANPNAIDANLAIDASADNGAAAGNVQLGTIGDVTRLDTLAIVGETVTFAGPVSARRVEVTANGIVTPTGQINTSQGFNGTSQANAALLLRGLSTPGDFGTREAPIRIDSAGLFVVIPNSPNTLPFVFLAGDPNKAPVYEFAGDPGHRRVFYNGAAPDSPADRAAQGAITQQLRSLLDELAVAGFAKENIRKQLLQGIVLETGLARPGIDEFVGEGVTAPPSCEPGTKGASSNNLTCP